MLEIEAELARRRIDAKLSRDTRGTKIRCKRLHTFIKESWHVLFESAPFVDNWHIEQICRHLEAITNGEFLEKGLENRLLINIPPSGMKSLIVCVFWPAWEWGPMGMPSLQYIATSFREDFCYRDAGRMRKLVMSDWYQANWPIRMTKTSEGHLENSNGGYRLAVPFGSLTGGKADRLLLDDPHSVDTAESELERERTTMRFRESVTTRVNDPIRSAIVVVMQRLNEKDIAGTILSLKLPYTVVMIPMRFEPERRYHTPFGKDPRTKKGELFFPARFPKEVVDRDEKAMTAYAVAGQHQQRPSSREGILLKRHWLPIVPAFPGDCRRVRGWDLAASITARSPFTCGVRIAYSYSIRKYCVEDVVRERVENPEGTIKQVAVSDGENCEIDLPQDPGAAGKIQARGLVAALAGYIAFASVESGDKTTRARPFAAQAEVGNVCLLEGPWNDAYLDEAAKFPTGEFLDQIDATSRAFGRFVLQQSGIMVDPIIVATPKSKYGDNTGGL